MSSVVPLAPAVWVVAPVFSGSPAVGGRGTCGSVSQVVRMWLNCFQLLQLWDCCSCVSWGSSCGTVVPVVSQSTATWLWLLWSPWLHLLGSDFCIFHGCDVWLCLLWFQLVAVVPVFPFLHHGAQAPVVSVAASTSAAVSPFADSAALKVQPPSQVALADLGSPGDGRRYIPDLKVSSSS